MGNQFSQQVEETPAPAETFATIAPKPVPETVSASGDTKEAVEDTVSASGDKKGNCGACCACPEAKQARDQCFVEHGEEHCLGVIDAYKKCMREAGFNI
ncbi:GL25652 [Drosophila persimilis]|uniref:Cytochrome c oxidase copper chaperone 1-like n=2 Tax=pseudoobscura subgroup TaxID=32358 RepID=A0A6I8UWW3_DROPS|nr:cytochrome c oxidase copper chaperone 1 [Drosophila persimilis]XP_002132264.2 cytochrome c oxidase copper chaperone 1 [Drosophila pseudoobscura]EDW37206.1 GL25652 [Drosophila persimilis]